MAIVRAIKGKPDFFITMTLNVNCPEIKALLRPEQSPYDRPDILCRVFELKGRGCDFQDTRCGLSINFRQGGIHRGLQVCIREGLRVGCSRFGRLQVPIQNPWRL